MNDEKYLDWSKLPAFTRELIKAKFQDIDIVIGILWYRYFSFGKENRVGIDELRKDCDYANFMTSYEFTSSNLVFAMSEHQYITWENTYFINRRYIDELNKI